MWALRFEGADAHLPWLPLSIAPFLAVMLRASMLISEGCGEDPQRMMARDRMTEVAGCDLVVILYFGIYRT